MVEGKTGAAGKISMARGSFEFGGSAIGAGINSILPELQQKGHGISMTALILRNW